MQHDVQELNRVLCEKLEEKMKVCMSGGVYRLGRGGEAPGQRAGFPLKFMCSPSLHSCLLPLPSSSPQGTKVERVINELFEGHTHMIIQCLNVDSKSSRKESFMDLQV